MVYYHYFTFGLEIQSELELPELLQSSNLGSIDLSISIGKTPANLPNYQKKGIAFEIAPNEFLLDLKDIARFYVTNGNSIVIEPKTEDMRDIRLFLLGSCFGTILHQRKILAMHASAIAHESKAVLFTGHSGIGKSTTANAFRLKGYKMLTDDVCPVVFKNNQPFALPGYPQSKLWEDTLEKLELDFKHFKYIREGINKRAIPIRDEFITKALPIKGLYILQSHNKDELKLLDIKDADRFRAIKSMTYRNHLLKGLGIQPYHFINSSQLANSIRIKWIVRPQTFCLPEVIELITNDLKSY